MRHLISLSFILFFLNTPVLAVDNPDLENENLTKVSLKSSDRSWGVGFSFGADLSYGVNALIKLSKNWFGQFVAETASGDGCCLGDNPSVDIPYGYEIKDLRKNRFTLLLGRNFSISSSGKWKLSSGVGARLSESRSRAQFYDAAFIGYDLNSPAGSSFVRKQNFLAIAQGGVRRTDLSFFSQSLQLSLLLELPVAGSREPPIYNAPNGRTVRPADTDIAFNENIIKFEATVLF